MTERSDVDKIGMARQIFGTVLAILRHGTPNFRHVIVSVPNVMWHQCSKFQGCRDYFREVVSARVNKARCQTLACRADFFSTCKWSYRVQIFAVDKTQMTSLLTINKGVQGNKFSRRKRIRRKKIRRVTGFHQSVPKGTHCLASQLNSYDGLYVCDFLLEFGDLLRLGEDPGFTYKPSCQFDLNSNDLNSNRYPALQ